MKVVSSLLRGPGGGLLFCRGLATAPPPEKKAATKEDSFQSRDLFIERVPDHELKVKDLNKKLQFGCDFSDYMLEIDWSEQAGWTRPVLKKTQGITIHPASKGLHYAMQIYEGLKAFRGIDNRIRLFRPELNMARMVRTARRAALPTFDPEQLIDIIAAHVSLDRDWIPDAEGAALYIRPFMFATDASVGLSRTSKAKLMVLLSPVGEYFDGASQGIRLLSDSRHVRACSGGSGAFKMGSNYAPTVLIAQEAANKGCQQVLWLSGKKKWVTEAGTMNFAMFWTNEQGEKELITPTLDTGLVLPGVTRLSVLELVRSWREFKVSEKEFTLEQMLRGIKEKRVHELFGCGTAAVVAPVTGLLTVDVDGNERSFDVPPTETGKSVANRIYREITDIQYGRKEMKDWVRIVA